MPDFPQKTTLPSGYEIAFRERETGDPDSPAILMLHGLGDDSTAWEHWTEDDHVFSGWNLYAVDLPGFGSSPGLNSSTNLFPKMVELVAEFIAVKQVKHVAVVAHSMGGVIGSLYCFSLLMGRGGEIPEAWSHNSSTMPPELSEPIPDGPELVGFINIEGNLTSADTFVSGKAVAANESSRFTRWMAGFIEAMIRSEHDSDRRYASALLGCEKKGFLAAAQALLTWSELANEKDAWCGALSKWLPINKLYIAAQDSIPAETRSWLDENKIKYEMTDPAGHFVMNDQPEKTAHLIESCLTEWNM